VLASECQATVGLPKRLKHQELFSLAKIAKNAKKFSFCLIKNKRDPLCALGVLGERKRI
jgi:hypothetical protein